MSIASSLGLTVDDAIVLQDSNRLAPRLLPCDVLARVAPVEHQVAQFEIELHSGSPDPGALWLLLSLEWSHALYRHRTPSAAGWQRYIAGPLPSMPENYYYYFLFFFLSFLLFLLFLATCITPLHDLCRSTKR
jgi:hypothetical protein